ncbi:MAG TPA: chemotaxis protein CheW [Burkholderiales bacterium]|nr:chemotaxis protein CheW [Burkholderiales bacterium]
MAVDMSEFYQVFFEEAGELLAEMETLLLDLDIAAPDTEHLNAIFRAAHSIKGGASTFGFGDMTEVTHILESLLDQIRKGEKALRPEMVDTFLAAGDVLKKQLAGHRGDGEADPAEAAAVCSRLKQFAQEQAGVAAPPPSAAAPSPAESTAPAPAAAGGGAGNRYHIEFVADSQNVQLLDRLFNSLEQLGRVELLAGRRTGGAPAEHFAVGLATAAPEEDVWELLAFLVDPAQIKITPAVAAPAEDHGFFDTLYQAVAPAPVATPVVMPEAAVLPVAPTSPPAPVKARPDTAQPAAATDKPAARGGDKTPATHGAAGTDAASIRVNIEKVDRLINLAGELVIAQAMLAQTASRVDPVTGEALTQGMGQLERNVRDLQEAVMSIRMMPIGFVFSRFPRVVHDLAAKLNKQVELKTFGETTELDKGLIEKIADPLTHLVRNSLDHGIETPDRRTAAGKPPKGTVTLRAFHQGGSIVIEVGDDGAGLNRERILAKAVERGLATGTAMSDQEIWQLIFEPGFSTAEVVTDVSGRGVGMDVVKRNILALGGSVEIDSALGVGTRMSIRLPLTLAILDGMSVAVGDQVFIVPLTAIVESLQIAPKDVKTVQGCGRVVQVRGEYLPVIPLYEVFGITPRAAEMDEGIMMILECDGAKKAIFVDELLGQHQVVIKSLESNYRKQPGISGATIMGDGRVALILDVAAIVRVNGVRLQRAA